MQLKQAEIAEGWRRMATFMAPFNINVTTVQPTSTQKNWSWSVIANSGGGYSWGQLGSFAPSAFNGSGELLGRFSGVLHELGHNFGLGHQGTYDDLGAKIREYRYRIDNIHGVVMGVDFDGYPSKWIVGHRGYDGNDAINQQDDLAIITGKIKPFDVAGADGFRADDYSNTSSGASALTVGGATKFGVIERIADSDYFSFASTGGTYKVTLTPDSPSSLDGKLLIYNSNGDLLAASDAFAAIDASVTMSLPAGTYYAVAAGHNNYGDIGTYAIGVATATPGTTPTYNSLSAPTGLSVTQGTGTDLSITWNAVAGATGYTVEQSLDGATYTTLSTTTSTSATATVWRDRRVISIASALTMLQVNLFHLPSSHRLIVLVQSPDFVLHHLIRHVLVLDWVETTGETGYTVERSVNGGAFSTLATVVANGVTYTDSTVISGNSYSYRVTPTSDIGNGVTSPVIANTPRLAAVTGFTVSARTTTSLTLSWNDIALETGYRIERSTDGSTYTTIATTAANVTSYVDAGRVAASEYYYRIAPMSSTVPGNTATAFAATLSANTLPSSWTATDIGSPSVGGTSDVNGGTFKIISATGDIWNAADQFRYTYTTARRRW